MKLHTEAYRKGGIHPNEVRFATLDAEVLRDGDKWWVKGNRSTVRFKGGVPKEHQGRFEYLVAADHLANLEWMSGEKGKEPHSFSATFESDARRDEPGGITLYDAAVLFGFSPNHGTKRLAQVIADAGAAGRLQVIPRGSETVLQVRDDQGVQSIVLASVNGRLLPVKVDILKGPSDMLSGKKLGDWAGGGENPAGKMVAFEQHIGPIEWDDKQAFIKSCEVRSIRKYHPGGDIEERTVHKVLKSHPPTDKELNQFVITSAVPNGTLVNIREMPHIAHEWRDGRIQKVLDMSAAANMHDTRFEQPAAPLFTLGKIAIGLSIVLAVVSIGWLVYRRTRGDS